MNTETVPQAPVGPPGYCGSVADELRRIAAAIDTVGPLELPEPTGVALWLQPIGTDAEVIAGVDALGKAVLGTSGEPVEMSRGCYHYKAYGQRGPVDVRFFRSIDTATAESVKAISEAAAREAELAELRARVAELEAQQVGLDYSREPDEADDPTPVSPARGGQPHVVAVTNSGLIDETPVDPGDPGKCGTCGDPLAWTGNVPQTWPERTGNRRIHAWSGRLGLSERPYDHAAAPVSEAR